MPAVRNRWFEIRLRPSTVAPPEGSMEEGFDPRRIAGVGVQFKAGTHETRYRGKVFVDACGWKEIEPAAAAAEPCFGNEGLR